MGIMAVGQTRGVRNNVKMIEDYKGDQEKPGGQKSPQEQTEQAIRELLQPGADKPLTDDHPLKDLERSMAAAKEGREKWEAMTPDQRSEALAAALSAAVPASPSPERNPERATGPEVPQGQIETAERIEKAERHFFDIKGKLEDKIKEIMPKVAALEEAQGRDLWRQVLGMQEIDRLMNTPIMLPSPEFDTKMGYEGKAAMMAIHMGIGMIATVGALVAAAGGNYGLAAGALGMGAAGPAFQAALSYLDRVATLWSINKKLQEKYKTLAEQKS
jgi:hypothetical protein